MTYTFTGPNPTPGYNLTFGVTRSIEFLRQQFFRTEWIGKITKKLSTIDALDVYDLNQRALLAYDLSRLLGTFIPQTAMIPFASIGATADLKDILSDSRQFYDYSMVLMSRRLSTRATVDDLELLDRTAILRTFIFDYFIGNFDKKDDDYVIDVDGQLWSIDYQLWGPCDDINHALGYCGTTYDFSFDNVNNYCIGTRLRSTLVHDPRVVDHFVSRIEAITDRQIETLVNRYRFYARDKTRMTTINRMFIDYFLNRRHEMRGSLEAFFSANNESIALAA